MTEIEQYEFDRQGYLVFEGMLNPSELVALAAAVDELEEHALARLDAPPRKVSAWGPSYHFNEERGYHAQGSDREGETVIIEDFWNASPVLTFWSTIDPRWLAWMPSSAAGRRSTTRRSAYATTATPPMPTGEGPRPRSTGTAFKTGSTA